MDLVRDILLRLEEMTAPDQSLRPENVEGYTPYEVGYHIKMMCEANLINCTNAASHQYPMAYFAKHITWEGHDFLDAIRNESVWKQTKSVIADKGGSMAFEVVKQVAIEISKKMMGI